MPKILVDSELFEEAISFVECNSEPWYKSGQTLLARLRAASLESSNLSEATHALIDHRLYNSLKDLSTQMIGDLEWCVHASLVDMGAERLKNLSRQFYEEKKKSSRVANSDAAGKG